jgi:hypothetical protein
MQARQTPLRELAAFTLHTKLEPHHRLEWHYINKVVVSSQLQFVTQRNPQLRLIVDDGVQLTD